MFSRALECGLGGWDDWDREVYGWCDRNRSAEYLEERLGLERERKGSGMGFELFFQRLGVSIFILKFNKNYLFVS